MFAIVVRSSHSYSNLETQRRRGFRKKTSGSGRFTSEGIQQQMFSPTFIDRSLIDSPSFVCASGSQRRVFCGQPIRCIALQQSHFTRTSWRESRR